jgi:Thioredoxin domain
MKTVSVKILGYKRSQRYSISRALLQAQKAFKAAHPDFHLDVQEVTTAANMLQFTPVIAFPSLMINEKLVCVGRFPTKEEVLAWLEIETQKTELPN